MQYIDIHNVKLCDKTDYYLRFSRPVKYSKFGDLLEQDEFNAVSFYSKIGDACSLRCVNSHNIVGVLHKLNIVYFYSLCRFLMTNLSENYAYDFYAEISTEKFNLLMRCASYEKSMTSTYLKEIEQECNDFGLKVHQIVDLFHSLLNKTTYSYELYDKTVYDRFCHTKFPNRFEILDNFSGIEFQFIEEECRISEPSTSEAFKDLYCGDEKECTMISHSFNDDLNTFGEKVIDEETVTSNTSDTNVFQQSLETVFNEYKSLENKYATLLKDYSSVRDNQSYLLLQIEHLNECLNQLNKEVDNLKEENVKLKEDKSEKEQKLKEFISSLGI